MHLRHKYCPFTAIVIFSTVLPNLADCFDHNLYQHGRSQSARGQWCVLNYKKNVLCGAMNCDETKASCGGNRCCSPRIYRYEGGREVMWRLVGGKLVNAGEISPRPTVRARKNVLCGAMNCTKMKASCGGNRPHSRRTYSREGDREVIRRLMGGEVGYGCSIVGDGLVLTNPMVRCVGF
jgi:hypothetical protein